MKKLMVLPIVLLSVLLIVSAVACGSRASSVTYCDSYHACPTDLVGDGYCDEGCNTAECNYDNGDCHLCASGCANAWLGNGYCNPECNTYACNYDGGDCPNHTAAPSTAGSSCPCAGQSTEWDAESCVSSYITTDAATTYNGRQVQAALLDAYGSGVYHGNCQKYNDVSWDVSVYFDTWAIEDEPLLNGIITQTSLNGPNNRESYSLQWHITSAGCIQATNGNALRLLTELQH